MPLDVTNRIELSYDLFNQLPETVVRPSMPSGTVVSPQRSPGGSNATFSVTASGSPVLAYQWRKDGLAIPAATNATLTLGNVQTTNSGTYDVVVTNSVGLATSDAAVLTVTPAAGQSGTALAGVSVNAVA